MADQTTGSFREQFLIAICTHIHVFLMIFSVSVTFLLFSFLAFLFVEEGSSAYIVLLVDVVLFTATSAITLAVWLKCRSVR